MGAENSEDQKSKLQCLGNRNDFFVVKNDIRCLMTNFESLLNKFDEFTATVHETKPDIIFGTETWLKTDITDDFVNIPGFHSFRTDTSEVRGGVIIYVRDTLKASLCKELTELKVKDTL